ncbi:LmeA family phospholipid-binding protein [Leifsonia sp. Leaf264]|uniref:LmeA family phospholipid-binding protein n=1 Tax=Leifsonia sp. Leaf264 TaxID=1736314 RepID=UPI0006FFC649|nr:LmeA family phospholipid-binding protein [Leifsonia sp. Leaf264]KQO99517.1 hypothetical protein ASF30_06225 [Leifsonia sp. Leaf264]
MTTVDAPKTRKRWPIVLAVVLVVVIGALFGAFFIADAVARDTGERLVAQKFAEKLNAQDGADVDADDIDVTIGGASVIAQYLSGTFESVQVDADDIALDGAPLNVSIQANGVPTDLSKPVQTVSGAVAFDQAGLDALLAKNGTDADITLGDGTVSYTASQTFIGIPLSFTLTAVPSTTEDSLVFTPQSGELAAGSTSIDISGLIDTVLADNTVSFCIADQIPAGVTLTGAAVSSDSVTVGFAAKDLVIADLAQTGTCS